MKFYLISLILLFVSFNTIHAQSSSNLEFSLEDINGDERTLSEYLEKGPVYVSFWALWCQPCLHKMRLLKPLQDEYGDQGFTFLTINTDNQNSMARVRAYVNAQGYDFPVLMDPNERVFEQFNGRTLPFAVMIDQNGKIVQTDTGFLPGDEKKIAEKIESLLAAE